MKLIVIYGLPAAGKYTVAKELEKITNFRLFHNHLSFDLVKSVINEENSFFWRQVRTIRLDMIKLAAEKNINLIFTTCYDQKDGDKLMKKLVNLIQKHKIKTYFVQLYCEKCQLFKRVKEESRKEFKKLKSVRELKRYVKEVGEDIQIPYTNSIKIDNSKISAKKTAKIIKKKLKLK